MIDLIILSLAVLIDQLMGEMPAVVHPVAWMGRVISFLERPALKLKKLPQLCYGFFIVLLVVAMFAVPTYYLLTWLGKWNVPAYTVIAAFILKATFSIRELRLSAVRIKRFLTDKNPEQARFHLRSLVSRDTGQLDERHIASAAIESVSENICDSFVAPLFYFLVLGIPGAVAYRVINTFDAMIGYHGEYEYLGKFAARLDSAVNYIPARISALLIVMSAFLSRRNHSEAWRMMVRDHGKTASPNAGWTMAAAAGALDIQLEKIDFYRLGDPHRPITSQSIDSMTVLLNVTAGIWLGVSLLVKVATVAVVS